MADSKESAFQQDIIILDVLQRYTTYDTAWHIAHPNGDEAEVDAKKARWVRLHPYNINQKVEVNQALNDLFGAEVSNKDQLQFLKTIADRISRQDDVMAQVNNHKPEQVMHGLFPKRVVDTVLDAMTDHEKLSLEVLDNENAGRKFALLVLQILTAANINFSQGGGAVDRTAG